MKDPFSKIPGRQDKHSASELRDRQLKDMIEKERTDSDAKTARLRALRLAKEAAEPPPDASPRRRKPKKQPSQ